MKHMIKAALAVCALALSLPAYAQTPDSTALDRPRVAVVLSGGGAKGVAHIGVLKVIERAGIPVDIVTGTSMGSIVGGLYALGYDACSLDSIVRRQNWDFLLSDKENLSNQNLADREKQNTYMLTKNFTGKKKDVSQGGFVKGKNLAELFRRLVGQYGDSIDFNTLPIPFACVATDIVTNTEYDFHSGYIAQAMRASMAIPGAFSPVRLGDKVLVDGGLRNNYPADVARAMGADIIIGVTVQGDPRTADDLGSVGSIIGQIVDVNCKNKYDENLAITDLPIRVNTKGYSSASFTPAAIDTLLRRGEEEALRHWDELLALKARLGLSDDYQPLRHSVPQSVGADKKVKLTALSFEGLSQSDERFLLKKFHLAQGDSLDTELAEHITTSMRVDLYYLDANFDGNMDILVGPAASRNYSTILLWDDNKGEFVPMEGNPLNGNFLVNPGKKFLVGQGSGSYCSEYYTRYTWQGNRLVATESLIEITDPKAYREYGVKRRYTVVEGDNFDNVAANKKIETNKKSQLPAQWRTILASYGM